MHNMIISSDFTAYDQWQSVEFGGMFTHQAIVHGENGPVLAIRDAQWGFIADIVLPIGD